MQAMPSVLVLAKVLHPFMPTRLLKLSAGLGVCTILRGALEAYFFFAGDGCVVGTKSNCQIGFERVIVPRRLVLQGLSSPFLHSKKANMELLTLALAESVSEPSLRARRAILLLQLRHRLNHSRSHT